jgi:hypothetical protein
MVNMDINMRDVRRSVLKMFASKWKKLSMRMDILQKRIRQVEIAEKIDSALEEYYSEKGMPVPQWKQRKDPQWWREYLIDLGLDPHNP